jgi:hypothetical protein
LRAGEQVLTGEGFVNAGRQRGTGGDTGDRLPKQRELLKALALRIAQQIRRRPAVFLPRLLASTKAFPNNLTGRERGLTALCVAESTVNRRLRSLEPPGHNAANRFRLDPAGALQVGWELLDIAAGRPTRRGVVIEAVTGESAAAARRDVEHAGFHVIAICVAPDNNVAYIAGPASRGWINQVRPLARRHGLDHRIHQSPRLNYVVLSLAS